MRSVSRGILDIADQDLVSHLDRCLGCQACEPVCPSGVEYADALAAARDLLADVRPIPIVARALNAIMAEPLLRKPVLLAARLIRPFVSPLSGRSRIGYLFGMLSATRPWSFEGGNESGTSLDSVSMSAKDPAHESGPPVALFEGCVMSGLLGHVHAATERTLAANGFVVTAVSGQACCGALHSHAGQRDQAIALARQNVAAFAEYPDCIIAVNSAGCGAMLKEYGTLLAGDPLEPNAIALASRVRDVAELLAERGPRQGKPVRLRVVYDPPCHLLHAQGISDAPLAILKAVPGLEHVAHADAEMCCGSAGSYSFTQSELSSQVLDRKVKSVLAAEPDVIATGNPGCIMQIGAGLAAAGSALSVVHPVEILDRSYARAGFYD
jgi:glycolate oxidase iron-sulfur subunit